MSSFVAFKSVNSNSYNLSVRPEVGVYRGWVRLFLFLGLQPVYACLILISSGVHVVGVSTLNSGLVEVGACFKLMTSER